MHYDFRNRKTNLSAVFRPQNLSDELRPHDGPNIRTYVNSTYRRDYHDNGIEYFFGKEAKKKQSYERLRNYKTLPILYFPVNRIKIFRLHDHTKFALESV